MRPWTNSSLPALCRDSGRVQIRCALVEQQQPHGHFKRLSDEPSVCADDCDQGFEGQAGDPRVNYTLHPRWNTGPYEERVGFQTPPAKGTINSAFKRAFFSRVAEITGYPGTESACGARARNDATPEKCGIIYIQASDSCEVRG